MTPARDHRGHQHISPPQTGFYTLYKHSAGSDSSLGFKFAIETLKHSSFGCNDCLCFAFMSHMVNSGQVSQCMRSRHKWGRHSGERYARLVSLSETRNKKQTYQTPPQCFCMTGAICWEGLTPWVFFFTFSTSNEHDWLVKRVDGSQVKQAALKHWQEKFQLPDSQHEFDRTF